ncbi:phytase [Catenovulum sp. 2E275]|uniref:phytase n=1 Tax=Catenovulum sp. 2E275 TaxID=2980497 RepID=UPI0021D07073|nr:phytase [Catenovulum sp. 2E275]MCU4676791.1 phytase [Catenovulum sp. 2E275]
MKLLNVSLLATALIAGLSGCSAQSKVENTGSAFTLSSKTLLQKDKLNGQKIMPFGTELWLANSENDGVMLLDNQGTILSQHSGNYEALDYRRIGSQSYLVASVEKENGRLDLFSQQISQNKANNQFKLLASIKPQNSAINNMCLYQAKSQDIYAFILTAQNMVEQRMVYQASQDQVVDYLIREFPAPPESSACSVDDKTGQLYIAEETTGIWQYPVNPERDLSRNAIAMQQPFGELEGEIKDIQILADGSLLVALPEIAQIQHYQVAADKAEKWSMQTFQLEQHIANESISAKTLDNDKVELAFYDDEAGDYKTAVAPVKLNKRVFSESAITEIAADDETAPVEKFGDAADDPEIWVNQQNPEQSLILGTDKRYGLYVFDLNGKIKNSIASGRVNNVDISYGATFNGETFDFAAASNRTHNSISLYKITKQGVVSTLVDLPTSLPDVYGLCTYHSAKTNQYYVFINDESGLFHQYLVDFSGAQIKGKLVREFAVKSQPEGCVADADSQTLYLGEEDVGLWKISAEADGGTLPELVYAVDNKVLFDDLEGVSIYHGQDHKYLVASSQGNDSYVVFSLKTHLPVANFSIVADPQNGIDGASETDGLAVTSANLGAQYPNGLLVVQDGRNVMPAQPQNFKLVSWDKISPLIKE